MIATAPLDPERTALVLIASPPGPQTGAPLGDLLLLTTGLLERARAAGAHVVHVRHLPGAADPLAERAPTAGVSPWGWETVIDAARPDPFAGTTLHEELEARGVEAVIVAGPMSLACCEAATQEALARRFRTVMADDATDAAERGPDARARLVRDQSRVGAEVLSSAAVATLLDAPAD